jgi:hypothetical protein
MIAVECGGRLKKRGLRQGVDLGEAVLYRRGREQAHAGGERAASGGATLSALRGWFWFEFGGTGSSTRPMTGASAWKHSTSLFQ